MRTRLFTTLVLAGLVVLGTSSPAHADTTVLHASLRGTHDVGQGDPDGSGTATVQIDTTTGRVCYRIAVTNIDAPSAAHIHRGGANDDGGVVEVNLEWENNTNGRGCVTVTGEPSKLVAITRNPSLYYVNVHNDEFPAGAIRGQLSAPFSDPQEALAYTGSNTTWLLAGTGGALISTGALFLRIASRREDAEL